jgi:hypothetical protein
MITSKKLKEKVQIAEAAGSKFYDDDDVKIEFFSQGALGSAGKIYDKKDKMWRWEFETSIFTNTVIIQDRTK